MFRRGWFRKRYAVVFGTLIALIVVIITAIASPLGNGNTYLPLVILQLPTPTPSSTGLLLITELLYNPTNEIAIEPAGEWVEIYNPGIGPILLSAYKLGDETSFGGREGMRQFPAGTILEPGEVIVVANQGAAFLITYGFPPDFEINDSDPFIKDMLPYHAWSTGNIELVNGGDEILLLDGNDNLVDMLTWGDSSWEFAFDPPPPPAGDGQSLERVPAYKDSDSAEDWKIAATPGPSALDLSTPTPEIPTGPTVLLISEVLYDPSGDDPAGEWVEIYNTGQNNALLSDYRLGDEETQGAGEGMYHFPEGHVLLSGQIAVIANRSIQFQTQYGFKPDYEIYETDPDIPNMLKDQSWSSGSMNLSASGDEIIILDFDDSIVDGVSWGSATTILDPSVPNVVADHSIERYPASIDTDSATDWRDQSTPDPNNVDLSQPTMTPSPTATSPSDPIPGMVINEIHADPDPAQGDANGDGIINTSQDEFIELVNTTEEDIDVGGWEIHDLTGPRHIFPDTLLIPSGCSAVIFAGGTPTGEFGNAIVQTSSSGILGLNNAGDTLTLYDLSSTVVNTYTYGSEGGDNQSITRDPDIIGPDPMIKHSLADNSGGALYSPGTRVDGVFFDGCTTRNQLKQAARTWQPPP